MLIFILAQAPFAISIVLLIAYIFKKTRKYKRWFKIFASLGFVIFINVGILSMGRPQLPGGFGFSSLSWAVSGYIMVIMLCIKFYIFRKIYRRSQDPENYHYNFFGKKVVHSEILTVREMREFMLTIPIFLFSGSYFIARLVNLILYGHL